MYEKCASTFGVFGLGRVHFTKFSLSPSFSYTFPHKGDVVYPTSVRGEPLSLHVFYILFFSCLFIWGVFIGFLHIWSIPCMLFIGLGLFCYFWCLIGPF